MRWPRRIAVTIATAAAVAGAGLPAYAAPPEPVDPVALVVGLRPGVPADVPTSRLEDHADVDVVGGQPVTGTAAVTVDVPAHEVSDAVAALREDPAIAYVELDRTAHAVAVTADDPYRASQWGLDVAGVAEAWQRTTGSPAVTVAVVDTGVDPMSDLDGAVLPGRDFVNDDTDPGDDNGHGTMAAGVLAARGDNGLGTAGVCWTCTILPVKVLDAGGSGSYSDIAAGIIWAADNGADIINLSLGGSADSQLLRDAVTHAADAGVLVVAAAGNDGDTALHYPAAIADAVAVGASTATDTRYSWSSYGSTWVDVAAPGCNLAQDTDGAVKSFCGTSSATPFLAGVAALARAAHPSATATDIRAALTSTAAAIIGDWVADGRVDAEQTLEVLQDAGSSSVSVTAPAAGAYLRGTVGITPTVADDVAVTRVETAVDGQLVASATAAPWTMSFDSTGFAGSCTVTVTVTAFDGDGNSTAVDIPVTIDNTPPTASFRSPGPGARLRGTVTVGINAADNIGVQRVELLAGNRPVGTDHTAPWVLSWRPGSYTGRVALTARVYDRAGNHTTITRTVTADNTRPSLRTTKAPKHRQKVRGTVRVAAAATDRYGISRVQLIVNGRTVGTDAKAPYTFAVKSAKYGKRLTVRLRAYDKAGNVRYTPVRTWRR